LVEDSANPDATPFVIDASGNVVVGSTTAPLVNLGTAGQFSLVAVGGPISQTISRFSANSSGPTQIFFKGRGLTSSDFAVVSSGDTLANIFFYGADGTQGISAASITASVDGTPGTNDMPGRLLFSTTADGASSPTERMRIDNAGNVGIGTSTIGGSAGKLRVNGVGNTATETLYRGDTNAGSGVTTSCKAFESVIGTKAESFTLPSLSGFFATQGTFGATSSVTSQFGFHANSTLTGATNNYGFYSNIASGTGRWNFYAAGTAANYFAGTVSIGTTSSDLAGNGIPYNIGSDGQNTKYSLVSFNSTTGNATHCVFRNGNGIVGTISTNASATTYATSSDYRLKDNITDAPSASDLIDAIRIRSFDWKADGYHQKYGVVAQELDPIAPEAVSKGKKEDDMWSVDYSKLVPMLVKEIQSLRSRVTQLEGN
jgi:hypothetical protein